MTLTAADWQLRAEAAEALIENLRDKNECLNVENAHLKELLNEKGFTPPAGQQSLAAVGDRIKIGGFEGRVVEVYEKRLERKAEIMRGFYERGMGDGGMAALMREFIMREGMKDITEIYDPLALRPGLAKMPDPRARPAQMPTVKINRNAMNGEVVVCLNLHGSKGAWNFPIDRRTMDLIREGEIAGYSFVRKQVINAMRNAAETPGRFNPQEIQIRDLTDQVIQELNR